MNVSLERPLVKPGQIRISPQGLRVKTIAPNSPHSPFWNVEVLTGERVGRVECWHKGELWRWDLEVA